MKSYLATALPLALLGIAPTVALPAPEADPTRILPSYWGFNITSLRGPGCLDFGKPSDLGYDTRLTYGMNTVDGSEIYYWHVAYPYFNAKVTKEKPSVHLWCETELLYSEIDNLENWKPKADYRLKLHKNGTRVLASYDLEKDVTATWKFTYYTPDDDEVVDKIVLKGPFKSPAFIDDQTNSPVSKDLEQYKLPRCGRGTITYRTDLYLDAKNGASGAVFSQNYINEGQIYYYGAQQGFSYDFEKCKK